MNLVPFDQSAGARCASHFSDKSLVDILLHRFTRGGCKPTSCFIRHCSTARWLSMHDDVPFRGLNSARDLTDSRESKGEDLESAIPSWRYQSHAVRLTLCANATPADASRRRWGG